MYHYEKQWKTHDGLTVYAQGWEPDIRPSKAVVCLVHGLGEHSGRYSHVADAFCKQGYALFGADTRGHGRSAGARGHFPSIEAVMKDIDQLLEEAKKVYPEIPLLLYGHSLGGILVLHYGLKRRPAIKGVIATSSGLRTALEKQPLKIIAAKVLGAIIPKVSLPSGLDVNAISHDENVIENYKNDPLNHGLVSLGFGKIMLATTKWTLEHSSEFPIPLLMLHGKSDAIAYPSGSNEFAAPLREKCKLVLFDNGYHELHNEPEKSQVFKTMMDWMDNEVKND